MKTTTVSTPADEQLVVAYLGGDNNALGILYNRYFKKVYNKCLTFIKNPDEAFDMAQDVLMKAFNKVYSFKGESSFSTWLFSLTQNFCISYKRRQVRFDCELLSNLYSVEESGLSESDFEARIQRETLEMEIDKYLSELSDGDKELLELKYRQNFSIQDLQNAMGLSASAVKMRLLRARNKVEQIYNHHNLILDPN